MSDDIEQNADPASDLMTAIDDCILAASHLGAFLDMGHPPFSATLTEGLAHYGRPSAMFQLWAGCRGIVRLREAKEQIDKASAVTSERTIGGR